MSYTPHEWSTGETITAAKLNALENGVAAGGGSLVCICEYNDDLGEFALDKTVREIYDAYIDGTPVFVRYIDGTLGPSGTGDYVSTTYTAPVVTIYGYNYDENIRICAAIGYTVGAKGSLSILLSPSIVMFSASSMSDYPTRYAFASVPNANISATTV